MDKIIRGNGFAIIEESNKIFIGWTQGPYGENVSYEISRENMEKALKSEEDAYEVMVFAETGKWPLNSNEQEERKREFIRNFPGLLLKSPENQLLFDKSELDALLEKIK
jgi:hypothetical protein